MINLIDDSAHSTDSHGRAEPHESSYQLRGEYYVRHAYSLPENRSVPMPLDDTRIDESPE